MRTELVTRCAVSLQILAIGIAVFAGSVSLVQAGWGSNNGWGSQNGWGSNNGWNEIGGEYYAAGLQQVDANGDLVVFPNGGAWMDDEGSRETIEYMMKCALPTGSSITRYDSAGTEYAFPGEIGLAPEWDTTTEDACGEACQEWVSACMLAHWNGLGKLCPIWLTSEHLAIGLEPHTDYPYETAAFFGNLFVDPHGYRCDGPYVDHACTGKGRCAGEGPADPAEICSGRIIKVHEKHLDARDCDPK